MSRYSTRAMNGNPVSYGYDSPCGYFYQEFDKDDENNCLVDLDSTFNGLTGSQLAEKIEYIALRKDHVQFAMMDLQF